MQKTSSWKQLIIELENCTANNMENAWMSAKAISMLWADKEFFSDAGSADEAAGRLQKYAGRWGMTVSDMLAMFKSFPKKSQWTSSRLDVIRDEAAKKLTARTARRESRNSQSWKQKYLALKAEFDSLNAKYDENCIRLAQMEKLFGESVHKNA